MNVTDANSSRKSRVISKYVRQLYVEKKEKKKKERAARWYDSTI